MTCVWCCIAFGFAILIALIMNYEGAHCGSTDHVVLESDAQG